MKLAKLPNDGYRIDAKKYTLDLHEGIEPARLFLENSRQEYCFTPSGSVNCMDRCDETAVFEKWQKQETKEGVIFTRTEKSVLWKQKKITVVCPLDS